MKTTQPKPPYLIPTTGDGKFHVRLTEGRFQNLRRLTSGFLMALYFILVWLQIDGQPLLMFSFDQHRIILFGKALFWGDLHLLAGIMIVAAFLLFIVAVAFGRVWCGFACPQSIWTWLFIRIEQLAEGRSSERRKQAARSLKGMYLVRRLVKHLLWIVLSLLTALTFSGYFIPIRELLLDMVTIQLPIYTVTWIALMSGITYLNAGLLREKICLHACPYSRFQSVMFDRNTLTVSYDSVRGEPRHNVSRSGAGSGDCVDCGLCVQVCPTGIDIREGLQTACIDCAACIDACDAVMDRLKRPRGLVRFASEKQLQGGFTSLIRPQLVAYGTALVFACTLVVVGFNQSTSLSVSVQRDRNHLFTQPDEQTICNAYQVRVEGFDPRHTRIQVSLTEKDDFTLHGKAEIKLSENDSGWLPYRVCTRFPALPSASLTFRFKSSNVLASRETTFLSRSIM